MEYMRVNKLQSDHLYKMLSHPRVEEAILDKYDAYCVEDLPATHYEKIKNDIMEFHAKADRSYRRMEKDGIA